MSGSPHPINHERALPPPENKVFYPALDGLRAVAILLVFTLHYFNLPDAINWGWTGVDLFFVLSGFLITGILYDSRNRPHRFRIFYIRRALRIFPVYYLVLLLPVLLYPIFRWKLHPALWLWPVYLGNFARFVWSADYLRNTSVYEALTPTRFAPPHSYYIVDHLWSLCAEEQFYLVWPLIVFLIKRRIVLRNLCLGIVVLTPVLRLICIHTVPTNLMEMGFQFRLTPLRADSLLLGGALALALRGPEAAWLRTFARPIAIALFSLAAIIEIISRLLHGHFISSSYVTAASALAFTFIALLAAALILLALEEGTWLYRQLTRPTLRAFGQRSYGFYVYHQLLFSVFNIVALGISFGHKRFLMEQRALVAFVGTSALAWISFRYFETPFLRLKARLAP